jgi:hypothetical protein
MITVVMGLAHRDMLFAVRAFVAFLVFCVGVFMYEAATMKQKSIVTDASGYELARLMVGIDARFRAVGVGPYFELAAGSYGSYERPATSKGENTGHYWATLGARAVVNP